jgi:NADH:ubiquinone oxidoreductase subunit 4 (subunit M)
MFTAAPAEPRTAMKALDGRELAAAVPLAVLTVALGIFPSLALSLTDVSVRAMTALNG